MISQDTSSTTIKCDAINGGRRCDATLINFGSDSYAIDSALAEAARLGWELVIDTTEHVCAECAIYVDSVPLSEQMFPGGKRRHRQGATDLTGRLNGIFASATSLATGTAKRPVQAGQVVTADDIDFSGSAAPVGSNCADQRKRKAPKPRPAPTPQPRPFSIRFTIGDSTNV